MKGKLSYIQERAEAHQALAHRVYGVPLVARPDWDDWASPREVALRIVPYSAARSAKAADRWAI